VKPYCFLSAPSYTYKQQNPIPNDRYGYDSFSALNSWNWYPNENGLAVDEATFYAATE
jgi:hypothetical protein